MDLAASGPEQRAPLTYVITLADPAAQAVDVAIHIPLAGAEAVELLMATWSPGFYRVEHYASRLSELVASDEGGRLLAVQHPEPNHWRILANSATASITVRYRLACAERSVTTNWVGDEYALLCGPATFLALVGGERQPHRLRLDLPEGWACLVALPPAPDQFPHSYIAPDFDALVDAPILAGAQLDIQSFTSDGRQHSLAAAGELGAWDGRRAARDLGRVADASARLWGQLPFAHYLFLVVCRDGGGGLEHADSTVVTANPARMADPAGYPAWIRLASHEYFHAFNVKRLRPRELGPFDYERPARTPSLWVAEGLTCYYTDLLLCRAGIWSHAQLLVALSGVIAQLQRAPGRLVQTLEESSLAVWENSFSGLHTGDDAVSYYTKGHVVGFLLDARIRRATDSERSLDDLMRLAYARFSGAEGFTPAQFEGAAAEVGGAAVAAWIRRAVATTDELEYGEALGWFGLALAGPDGASEAGEWEIRIADPDDSAAAARRSAWLGERGADTRADLPV